MANLKEKAVWAAEKNAWQVQVRQKNGTLKVRDDGTYPLVDKLSTADALRAFGGYAKSQKTLRESAMSLLADILTFSGEALAAYKGVAAKDQPLPTEMAQSFRMAEDAYFKRFLAPDHPDHDVFMKALPTLNERGEKLVVGGMLNPERQFQYFLTTTRKFGAYAQAKTIVLGYWGYCGLSPVSEDGKHMVPPEIMRMMVDEARNIAPADNSLKQRLYDIRHQLIGEGITPPDDDMPEIVATLRDLLSHAEGLEKAAAQRRSVRPQPGNVRVASDEAIRKAQESTGRYVMGEEEETPTPAEQQT